MQINQAYEVLGDPERKQRYDRFGTVDESQQQSGHYHQYGHFDDFVSVENHILIQL